MSKSTKNALTRSGDYSDDLWLFWFSVLFYCDPTSLHNISYTPTARYSLFVLKVPLNTSKPTNLCKHRSVVTAVAVAHAVVWHCCLRDRTAIRTTVKYSSHQEYPKVLWEAFSVSSLTRSDLWKNWPVMVLLLLLLNKSKNGSNPSSGWMLWRRLNHGLSVVCLILCFWVFFGGAFHYCQFRLSVPVQVIDWRDSSPNWYIICWWCR